MPERFNLFRRVKEVLRPEIPSPQTLAAELSKAKSELEAAISVYPEEAEALAIFKSARIGHLGLDSKVGILNNSVFQVKNVLTSYLKNPESRQKERVKEIVTDFNTKFPQTSVNKLPEMIQNLIDHLINLPQ